jgi:hypothetical protein
MPTSTLSGEAERPQVADAVIEADMRVRLTADDDGSVVLEAAYRDWEPHREAFKSQIPYDGRRWDSGRRKWIITALYAADVLQFLQHIGADVLDDRPVPVAGTAIPAMPDDLKTAFDTLHLQYDAPLGGAEAMYKFLAKAVHPDHGGSGDEMAALNAAIVTIRHYLTGAA